MVVCQMWWHVCHYCFIGGRWYCHFIVISWLDIDRCYCQCGRWKAILMMWWQMLLPMWQMEQPHLSDGRCYCHCGRWNSHTSWNVVKADLIAFAVDGIAKGSLILIWILCCLIKPHPICEADGICLYFCSGMGCWPYMYTGSFISLMSHHVISATYNIISTLLHRAKDVCSTKEQLEEQNTHIQKVLMSCKYPEWAVSRIKMKTKAPVKPKNNNKNNKKDTNSKIINRRGYITVPYMKGLSESIKNTCKIYGIQVYFKGSKTIKDLLVALKDKEHITKKEWYHL